MYIYINTHILQALKHALQAFINVFQVEELDVQRPPADCKVKQDPEETWPDEPCVATHDDYMYVDLTSPIKEVSTAGEEHPHDRPSMSVVDAALNRLATDDIEDCLQPTACTIMYIFHLIICIVDVYNICN